MTGAPEHERRIRNRKVALNAVKAGIPILLVTDDKVPLIKAYQRLDAAISPAERAEIEAAEVAKGKPAPAHIGSTLDGATVRALFKRFPDALPAACGGPAGLLVVDADTKRDGVAKFEAWLAEHGHTLPDSTPVTVTQSGGRHYVFRDPDGLGNHAGALNGLGCDVRGKGGLIVLPGAVRANGAAYRQAGDVGLFYAFASGSLPVVPDFIRSAIAGGGEARTRVGDAETAALIDRLRQAELPDALDCERFVADDKGSDRSAWRLALANRMRAAGHTAEEYFATLIESEAAGTFVGERSPDEGEFNHRNVARDWLQADQHHAETVATGERMTAASALFGDVSDTLQAAAAAVASAVGRGESPDAEVERMVLAAANADDVTAEGASACADIETAFRLGLDLGEPLARLQAATGGKVASKPAEFEPEHYREAKAKATARKVALPWEDQHESAQLMRTHRAEPLIDGVLECGAISVVYGQSNVGKSFVVAGIGYAVASGLPWHVHASTKGAVVYVGLEGRSGFRRRVAALRADVAPKCADPAIFATTQVDGLSLTAEGSEAARVIATVREVQARGGLPVRLIVIDTLAAVTAGSDENSGRDMGAFVGEVKRIAAACPGVHVLIVHHTGKDQAKGARGHSSLRAAVDTELEVTVGEIRVTKQRDMPLALPIAFRLEPVDLGVDEQGQPLRSAIARLNAGKSGATLAEAFGAVEDDDGAADERAKLSADHRLILDQACMAIGEASGEAVAPAAIVATVRRQRPDIKENTIRTTLRRRLAPGGFLERIGENYRLVRRAASDA